MRYIILPLIKFIGACFIAPINALLICLAYVCYVAWYFRLDNPYQKNIDYYDNIFECSFRKSIFSKNVIVYKTHFHWAFDIGKITIPNFDYSTTEAIEETNSTTFKEFIKIEKQ